MILNSKQFYFLEESNRNINFKELNSIILNNFLTEQTVYVPGRGYVWQPNTAPSPSPVPSTSGKFTSGLKKITNMIFGNDAAWRAYLADEKSQGPLGRLGGEYREAGIKAFLAPYKMPPQALKGSTIANLRRTGRTSETSQIQYGPVDF